MLMRLAEQFWSCCLDFLLALFGIVASPSLTKSNQSFNSTIMPLSDKPKRDLPHSRADVVVRGGRDALLQRRIPSHRKVPNKPMATCPIARQVAKPLLKACDWVITS